MLRLLSLGITAIALLYALEFSGVVEERSTFPTLPRLEASAADPNAWVSAAAWGASQLQNISHFSLPQTASNQAPHHGKMTDRVVAKDKTRQAG